MRKYRYIWLPAILLVYFIFMTFRFGLDMLREGRTLTFALTCAAELIVLGLLSWSLKRRERLRSERESQR